MAPYRFDLMTDWIFPPFRLDSMHGRLCRDTKCVPIRFKTLAVLRHLIEHRERVISSDELIQTIWPGRFGADAAPKQCILELRKLLGDSARHPRFIETVGHHGYRFIGPIEAEPNPTAEPSSARLDLPNTTIDWKNYHAGREIPLTRLQAAWEQAQTGRPQCVFLLGPAGIGKTTVAETFMQRINVGLGWVARGQCIEQQGKGETYLPLLDALSSLAHGRWRTHLVSTLHRQAPLWLLQLPQLIPSGGETALRRRVQGTDSARMLRELIETLEVLTSDEPGLLLLEDLQWADPATLEWLNAWMLRRGAARLLLMATWRTGAHGVKGAEHQATATRLLSEWRRRSSVTLLPLAELEPMAVETYLHGRFADAKLASRLAPVLHRRCGGQPFLMHALIEQWLARHLLVSTGGEWRLTTHLDTLASSIPITARELIESRLADLSLDERQTLEAASVMDAEFSTVLIAAVLDSDHDLQERRCAALTSRHGLLTETGLSLEPDEAHATRYAFRHALYRDVIYDQLTAGRRSFLHRRIEQALEIAHARCVEARIFAGRVLRVGSLPTRTRIGGSQDRQEHVAGPLGGLNHPPITTTTWATPALE